MIELHATTEHPIPFDLSDEEPKTHADSIAIAINTADLIAQLGPSIDFSEGDLEAASKLILGENKPAKPKTIAVSAQAQAISTLVKTFDFNTFADQLQARNFITNRLVELANNGDPKVELKALELLGKHSDIGLFTERSEITIHHTTSSALENSIKERVKRLLNADVIDITPLDDLDAQLGPADGETGNKYSDPVEVQIPQTEVQDNG
jgi:hypothetical protein